MKKAHHRMKALEAMNREPAMGKIGEFVGKRVASNVIGGNLYNALSGNDSELNKDEAYPDLAALISSSDNPDLEAIFGDPEKLKEMKERLSNSYKGPSIQADRPNGFRR